MRFIFIKYVHILPLLLYIPPPLCSLKYPHCSVSFRPELVNTTIDLKLVVLFKRNLIN